VEYEMLRHTGNQWDIGIVTEGLKRIWKQ